ncbi:MAG: guanine deaminase [Pegethrix bostrychoides GSE-TBD4-15B]|jgi:guanine deaminase|uniref:Guanine deaminase n=1 Tax=Pegethrix bostrychoides GSE-TBD4-15B TaxID=2839662 RepID=A0A951P897_9CYAN|nr:guanine deaminase [Pegethrix bostrychoides GSE-TBD4-15B]
MVFTASSSSAQFSSAQSSSAQSLRGFRGAFLDFLEDPFYQPESEAVRYIPDGLLVVEAGNVKAFGAYETIRPQYVDLPITTYADRLLMPGFIDLHLHFPQTEMIAAYGEQLLEWLNKYTFPTERRFQDMAHAQKIAVAFIDELLRNGTTTAVVLAAVFPESAEALFAEAERRNLCLIAGKVMMDRNAPDFLTDTAASSYDQSKQLIEKWHRRGRLRYAVTPRFAPTSTAAQLELAGLLLQEYPDVYLHTHLSENVSEVAWVQELFPNSDGYLDAYDQAGLVTERSIFAHCVQLTDREFQRLSEAKSTIAFCPTSNLFLGSGLFKLEQAKSVQAPIHVGLATDIGAGTSFSMLQTANEAYKVAQLRQQRLSPFQALFLATLGGALALGLEAELGNFNVGKAADFVVLDLQATPIMALRNPTLPDSLAELADSAFSLIMMGDDRSIQATYIQGEIAYARSSR